MFDFEKLQRIALSAVGALILSSAAIAAAVGPARAIETAPVVYAAAQVANQANG